METFAYLQVAQDYEDPEGKELVFLKDGLTLFKSINGLKLPSQTLFILLGVACSAFVLNIANAAQAALYRGDSGSDVTYLQNLLNNKGYSVPVTGYYGAQTETQVYNFQYDNALTADGIAGSATLSALEGFVPINPDTGSSGTLRYGDSGSAVTNVQYLLNDSGYFYGPYTGYFGASTEQAVISFQYDNGLTADGVVGSATLSALQGYRPVEPDPGTVSGALSYGDQGADVTYLQNLLNAKGYSVSVTGYFGSATEQQVRNFQYDNYLTVDGIAGSSTLAALESDYQALRPGDEIENTYQYLYGDSGDGVYGIQKLLKDRGYYYGALDGVYGPATYDAVARYQAAQGLPVDGIWGPQTAAASV